MKVDRTNARRMVFMLTAVSVFTGCSGSDEVYHFKHFFISLPKLEGFQVEDNEYSPSFLKENSSLAVVIFRDSRPYSEMAAKFKEKPGWTKFFGTQPDFQILNIESAKVDGRDGLLVLATQSISSGKVKQWLLVVDARIDKEAQTIIGTAQIPLNDESQWLERMKQTLLAMRIDKK